MFAVREASVPNEIAAAREVLLEYSVSLEVDLWFQGR
jgi:hypothetical protein